MNQSLTFLGVVFLGMDILGQIIQVLMQFLALASRQFAIGLVFALLFTDVATFLIKLLRFRLGEFA